MDRKLATFFSVIKDLAIKVLEKEYYDVLLHNNNYFFMHRCASFSIHTQELKKLN